MEIIAQNQKENNINNLKGFWLHFFINGEGSEFLDYDLPIPTYLEHLNRGYAVAWLIDGYFGTKKGEEFLNDVIARFLLSFADLSPQRLPYKPKYEKDNKTAHILNKAYSLKKFSKSLKSLPTKKKFAPNRADMFEDFVFWAIKLYAEDLIRDFGLIPYEQLEDFALNTFLNKKDRSTLKAKVKSIWNYYDERNWELPKKKHKQTKGEYKMTRIENMTKVNKERAEIKKRAILNITSGMFAEDYKFKSSKKWNIAKIAKELGIAKDTVKKYLPN